MTTWLRLAKRVANIVINLFMENREQQILSEIKALMSSVRLQLEQLDLKMAELQQVYDPQVVELEEIDLGFDMPSMAFVAAEAADEPVAEAVEDLEEETVEEVSEQVAEEVVEELEINAAIDASENEELPVESVEMVAELPEESVEAAVEEDESDEEDDLPFYDTPEVEEDMPEAEETEAEDEYDAPVLLEADEEEDLPLFAVDEVAPVTLHETAMAASAKSAVIDVMTAKQAWRTDMPGSPVKDIRAAIALVDRALFINKLFGEDAASFMETINTVNQMSTLDEVVEYLASAHPTWNFESDIVYRFMMAIRRKVN